jgi:hypothetical protein
MDKFKILICEDEERDIRNITLYLNDIKKEFLETEFSIEIVDFNKIYRELLNEYDLLILDLYDRKSDTNAGENVLLHNNGEKKIPTLIYTAAGDALGFDLKLNKPKYPFLIDKLTKIHNSGENLKDFVRFFIVENGNKKYYTRYNLYDTLLNLGIKALGENNFNSILYKISKKFANNSIIVYPMNSGLSGAVLFKLNIDNSLFILKAATDIDKLREEYENGGLLYHKFPSHMVNHIEGEEFYSYDKSVLGILIKNVDDSQTLYNFITDSNNNQSDIQKILNDIFLASNGLSNHYQNQKGNETEWISIFDKIDDLKLSWIEKSYEDLKLIVLKYYKEIKIQDLELLCIDHKYNNLNKFNLLQDNYKSRLVLSHGDMHAKNILIQNKIRPIIIDTGALGYQHWSLDISRLFANIFTLGIDKDTINYFELEAITKNIELFERILNHETTEDDINNNIVFTLNWLNNNLKNIYGNSINQFEFYLGLAKEFLQISYRLDTIPPNKRAEALIIAHKLIEKANDNV